MRGKTIVAAVFRRIAVQLHEVSSGIRFKPVVREGALRVKVKRKQEPGPRKNNNLVI